MFVFNFIKKFMFYTGSFVDDYILAASPIPTVCILGLYYYFVKVWGPKFMKNRQPYDLKNILIIYNLFQVFANLYVVLLSVYTIYAYNFDLVCSPNDYSNTPKARKGFIIYWLYSLLKVLDLLDTVFFILRKKLNQVTVLHVYHHGLMIIMSYIANRYLSGGLVYMVGLVNSFAHFVMYFYYFMSCIKTDIRNSLSWKKHITHVQLVQFLFLSLYFCNAILRKDCHYDIFTIFVALSQNLLMIILFSNFYYHTYIRKRSKS